MSKIFQINYKKSIKKEIDEAIFGKRKNNALKRKVFTFKNIVNSNSK